MTTMPDWVPEGVRRAAAVFENSRIAHRLTHDPRMERIWNQLVASKGSKLPRHKVSEIEIANLPIEKRCNDETGLSNEDKAAAALFFTFCNEMTNNNISTKRDRSEEIDEFNRIAELCRMQRYFLYPPEIESKLGSNHPSRDPQLAQSLENTASYFQLLAEAITSTKGFRWGVNKKRDIERSRVQAQMSEIIVSADRLYTPELRATLRHIAQIGFAIKVSNKDIDNWRGMSRRGPKTST